jgi:predicted RecB family nuclease
VLRINDEILLAFINCQYKAYRKSKKQKGIVSDYEMLYDQLKLTQKTKFKRSITESSKLILHQATFDDTIPKEGFSLDFNFKNENIDLTIDGIEFAGKKKSIPIFITPFEKITRGDKLFIALQSYFIQNEFNLHVEHCKVVFGKNTKQTKFKLSSFSRAIKKGAVEMSRILSNSNAPQFISNNHCQVCEFPQDCLTKLTERDDLSLLAGLKPKEIQQKNSRGIFSVKQLSYTFRPKKNPYRKRKFLPELKALAIREGKTFIQEIPIVPTSPNTVFLDIEGIPNRDFYYLIGAIVKTDDAETNYSFWANDESEEQKIFIELFTLLQSLGEFTIFHYGSYEIHALKKTSKVLPPEHQKFVKKIIDKSFNLLNISTHNIYPPTYSNSLKDIARFIKFNWTEKAASGLQSIVWRCRWEITQNDELKNKLIQYNLEDCAALTRIRNWIINLPEDENHKKTDNLNPHCRF